jgi:short-subunit dehydrogenase
MTADPVLIIGAKSDIGLALAHRFAAAGHPVQLAARAVSALAPTKADIELRHGVAVSLHEVDILATPGFAPFLDGLPALPGVAICAVGLLGEQAVAEQEPSTAARTLRSNFEGPALLLGLLANRFEARGSGTLVGISSVAGERGRASNYVYGSAKAGYTAFLSGLRNRLARKGVHVLTVLPGFVQTRMTEGMDLPPRLTVSPDQAAAAIFKAVAAGKDVIHVKRVWWLIMIIIRAIPERIFKNLQI